MAEIKPEHVPDFTTRQSKVATLCDMLPTRMILTAPSGHFKTVAMQSLILHQFRGCFKRIYIWSPTVHLDTTWEPVKTYIRNEMKVPDNEEFCWEDWDEEHARKLLDQQTRIVRAQKEKSHKHIHGVLFLVDDFADRLDVLHSPKGVLTHLFLSGRHRFASCWISTQALRSIAKPIRINATALLVGRLRNKKEYETIEDEVSNLLDKDTFKQVYEAATDEAHSFLFIKLNAKSLNSTFMIRFEKRILFA